MRFLAPLLAMLASRACALAMPAPGRLHAALRATAAAAAPAAAAAGGPSDLEDVFDSVVRIYCTHSTPCVSEPWTSLRQSSSTSTGFVISVPEADGSETLGILTNAHAVEYASSVLVRRRGIEEKFECRVRSSGQECDLALLVLEDPDVPSFWDGLAPLPFSDGLPDLQEDVSVVGYPIGGDAVSVTSGVVSRVDTTEYAQGSASLLAVQIDAAINPGNSGGPVLDDDLTVVGVAFQSLVSEDTENVGYVIPIEVVQHFLEDLRRSGRYVGFPKLGVSMQPLENDALRRSLGMRDGATGVLLSRVEPTAPAAAHLQDGDVLLEVDGVRVGNDATVAFGSRRGERVALQHLFASLFADDKVDVKFLRDGAVRAATAALCVPRALVPAHHDNTRPPYVVVAGFVFVSLSVPYLRAEMDDCGSGHSLPVNLQHLVTTSLHGELKAAGDEVVILSHVLAHRANRGYEHLEHLEVKALNSKPVRSLAQFKTLLAEAVADPAAHPVLKLDCFPRVVLVLDTAGVGAATADVLQQHAIPGSGVEGLGSSSK